MCYICSKHTHQQVYGISQEYVHFPVIYPFIACGFTSLPRFLLCPPSPSMSLPLATTHLCTIKVQFFSSSNAYHKIPIFMLFIGIKPSYNYLLQVIGPLHTSKYLHLMSSHEGNSNISFIHVTLTWACLAHHEHNLAWLARFAKAKYRHGQQPTVGY